MPSFHANYTTVTSLDIHSIPSKRHFHTHSRGKVCLSPYCVSALLPYFFFFFFKPNILHISISVCNRSWYRSFVPHHFVRHSDVFGSRNTFSKVTEEISHVPTFQRPQISGNQSGSHECIVTFMVQMPCSTIHSRIIQIYLSNGLFLSVSFYFALHLPPLL